MLVCVLVLIVYRFFRVKGGSGRFVGHSCVRSWGVICPVVMHRVSGRSALCVRPVILSARIPVSGRRVLWGDMAVSGRGGLEVEVPHGGSPVFSDVLDVLRVAFAD